MTRPSITARGWWELTAPPGPSLRPLAGGIAADVAIIGAGVTGLSAALILARKGTDVVVLEADQVGSGAVGRSGGLVNAGMWIAPEEVRRTLGPAYGDRLLHALGQAPQEVFQLIREHNIACDPEPIGTLQCAVGAGNLRYLEKRAASWRRIGADVVLLDSAETAKRVGSSHFDGAMLDNRTGTVQPLSYVRGLAAAAMAAGARVFGQSPACRFESQSSTWMVATPQGEVRAQQVLFTTDTYARSNHFKIKSEFVNLPYFFVATEPLTEQERRSVLPSRQATTDTRKVLSSYRLDRSGRLIVGSIGRLSGSGALIHVAWARRAINRLFPHLRSVHLEHGWHGSIGMTRTHLPAIHQLGPGILSVGGYNGRGIAAGSVIGRMVAEYMLGHRLSSDLPLPISPIQSATFRMVQEQAYEWGASVAHLVDALGARRGDRSEAS